MAITLSGITWVVAERPETQNETQPRPNLRLGLPLAVCGALLHAIGMVLARKGIRDYDAVAATFIRVLGALPGYFIFITLLGRWPVVFRAVQHGPRWRSCSRAACRSVVGGDHVHDRVAHLPDGRGDHDRQYHARPGPAVFGAPVSRARQPARPRAAPCFRAGGGSDVFPLQQSRQNRHSTIALAPLDYALPPEIVSA